MSEWKAKRFWDKTEISADSGGFGITLDGRSVKTPAKALLSVPTEALARAIQAEWAAQEEQIDPLSMPFTRSANAAIDKTSVQLSEVATIISDYGDSDLLCYRAEAPEALVQRQAEAWDPMLDWAAEALGARLNPVAGVMYQAQPEAAVAALRARVAGLDAFTMTGFHDLVSLSGSLVLGFAALLDGADVADVWSLSRIDEEFQIELWGRDEEAAELAETKRQAFFHAKAFCDLIR